MYEMAMELHSCWEPARDARDSEWQRESRTAMARAPTFPNIVEAIPTLLSWLLWTQSSLPKTSPTTNPEVT